MSGVKPISPWQFAVFRILLGLCLVVHLVVQLAAGAPDAGTYTHRLLPNALAWSDAPAMTTAWLAAMLVLSAGLTTGVFRRVTCVLLWYGWSCLFNRADVVANPTIPAMGVTLLLTALVPPGEPLSVHGRREGWAFPQVVFLAGWTLLAISYGYSGVQRLVEGTGETPLAIMELLFPVLCVTRTTRLVAWIGGLAIQIGLLLFCETPNLTAGVIMFHLFVFDPEWLPARRTADGRQVVFFDGVCVLCHASVKLLLEEDRERVLVYAPLQGTTFEGVRAGIELPDDLDSIVYVRGVGAGTRTVAVRSQATLEILRDIGGFWRVVSWLRVVPRPLRDRVYRTIATHRYRWFGRHDECRLPTEAEAEQLMP